jgi:dipeptidyl aminopeptidase/acylaminoacyl peptidase
MKTVRSKLAIPVACLIVLTIAFLSGCGGTEPGTKLKDPTREPVEAASEGQLLTIDDVLDIDAVSEFRISPDGSSIAWVVDGQELFLVDIEAGGSRQVDLPGGVTVAQPRWSPDSKRLAFISDAPAAGAGEPGLPQVWVLDVTGEGLSSITEALSGVIALSWAGLDTILYTSPDGGPEQRPGDNTIRVSDYSDTPTRLFSVNLETQAVEKLTDNDDRITSISASPDGKHAFYTRTMCVNDIYLWQWQQKIPFDNYLFDLETREEKQVFAESRWIVGGGGQWSPDSDRLYVIDNYDTDEILANYLSIVRSIDIESGAEEKINLDWSRGVDQMHSLHYGCLAPTDEGFLALLADGPNPRLANYTRPGSNWERSMLEGQHQGNIFSFDASANGKTICYNYSTSNDPQQLYVARLNGSATLCCQYMVVRRRACRINLWRAGTGRCVLPRRGAPWCSQQTITAVLTTVSSSRSHSLEATTTICQSRISRRV